MRQLVFQNISKSYGSVRALRDVSFPVVLGEAHALVGENGAGKSTLMKILAGITHPDGGRIVWDKEEVRLRSPHDALDRGIGMVNQETMLFPNLTVWENIFAGRELTTGVGLLRKNEMRRQTDVLLRQLHLPIPPEAPVASLGAAHQQLVQIARALAFECRILILDEPTTSLTDAETQHLFDILGRLKTGGVTLIYVSHKLAEVFRLCDRVTVLRDGEHVATVPTAETTPRGIVRHMVGRDLDPSTRFGSSAEHHHERRGAPMLTVERLTRRPWFEEVSLAVHPGEIVGLFGLVGSGRTELVETIFGLHRPDAGHMRFEGRTRRFTSPIQAVRAGIVLAPESRHQQGLFFNLMIRDNLVLPREQARGAWRVNGRAEAEAGRQLADAWRIKTAGLELHPDSLSGGNQQKVVLAKWLGTEPRLLLLDEPTKGVDVGAKREIHGLIRQQADGGMGCLLVSSELPEILALADRIAVLREGRIQGELPGDSATEEAIMRLATAVRHEDGHR
jgi:ABC-type sugar transport system ATPase subunit